MQAALKAVVGEATVNKGRIKIELPPLVENGNAVPLGITVESPMTDADHVKAIHVFTEKNPQPNVVSFQLGPRAGTANIQTRMRLADTQIVTAVAEMSDGTLLARRGRGRRHHGRLSRGKLMAARALINVPPKAKRGEVIGIKSLISHEMETGFRPNATGQLIPRNIIKEFVCTYNGIEVFRAEFFPAVSANPFVSFTTRRDRERHHHDDLERRQRLLRHRVGRDHRRITRMPAWRIAAALAIVGVTFPAIAEIPTAERKSGYDFMASRKPRDAGRRHRQCRHTVGARRRDPVEPSRSDRRKVLRRLPWRRPHQHEGRGRALSRLQPGARPPCQSRAANQYLPRRPPAGEAVRL